MGGERLSHTGLGARAGVLVLSVLGSFAVHSNASAQTGPSPTFAADVAPIIYENCILCHQPEGIAPMSLISYEEARPWASRIRLRVEQRLMPPWHLDKTVGIQDYKNDISLTDEEIQTIVRWVGAGAPEGDPANMPPVPELPTGDDWQLAGELGPPDLIVRSTPYDVKAGGQDQWWTPEIEFEGIEEPRWIMAYEFKPSYPGGKKVVHHGHANFVQGDGNARVQLADYGVGKGYQIYPENSGVLLPAGRGSIVWNIHYAPFATDLAVLGEVTEAGVWFYPEGYEPEIRTGGERLFNIDRSGGETRRNRGMSRGADILIPPHSYQVLQGVTVLDTPAVMYSVRPHLHTRGKELSIEAIYPDGRREMLFKTDKYRQRWQIAYQFADRATPLLPRGTVLLMTSVFDNTAANVDNPDPNQWVTFGRGGVHEMSHAWIGITDLTQEEYDKLKAERDDQLAAQEQQEE
jgi:hypothetical protein